MLGRLAGDFIPASLLVTLAAMRLAGFTLDTVSLLAMTCDDTAAAFAVRCDRYEPVSCVGSRCQSPVT